MSKAQQRHRVIHGDCLRVIPREGRKYDCIFADPPDNIDLDYGGSYKDKRPVEKYVAWLEDCLKSFLWSSPIVWLSYNSKWNLEVAGIVSRLLKRDTRLTYKPCVQIFTFGQHNKHDLGSCHRPLLRIMDKEAKLYPDQIRVASERMRCGDKRANPLGKVPGDVFDFPRVTGNSKQRRKWCPTQLHEDLVDRCVRLNTKEGDTVLDPFGGTGTTLRVCKRIGRKCTIIECDAEYCDNIAKDNDLEVELA